MVIVQEKSPKKELLPGNCYLFKTFLLKWVGSGIWVPEKNIPDPDPGSVSRIRRVKKHRIQDLDPQHCFVAKKHPPSVKNGT
jgi:hypothetical protein